MSDGGIFGAIASGLGTLGQMTSQQLTNQQNEQLMRESWKREDNAVQRRQRDMIKAGINPLMAAGSAATSSGPAKMEAPLKNNAGLDIVDALRGMVSTDQIKAQTDLIKAQQDAATAGTRYTDQQTANLKQDYDWKNQTQPTALKALVADTNVREVESWKADMDKAWLKQGVTTPGYDQKVGEETYIDKDGNTVRRMNYERVPESFKGNFEKQKEFDMAIKQGQAEAAKYTDDLAQQQLVSMALAMKKMGMENQIMEELSKTNPGLADGIGRWLNTLTGWINPFKGTAMSPMQSQHIK
ncbi:MAG: DNA pilot protein [Arizlama microvirus]|nr:MAG: DNA pilot protein [Arizlama microvirus]